MASSLLGAVAQRLLRTNCPKCKAAHSASPEELAQLLGSSEPGREIQLHRGQGCDGCYHGGYRGRKAIYEILAGSPEIYGMIVDQKSDDAIKKQAISEGMKTLRRSGIEQVLNGTTTLKELMRVVDMRTE